MSERTVHRICTLCEATCGIVVRADGDRVVSIEGDQADPFSEGYVCPKAFALKDLHEDPDRLHRPLIKTPEGGWREASWEDALTRAAEGLKDIRERYGADSIASYAGNPSVHNLHTMVYLPVFLRALGSKQRYSASSVDQFPKMVSAGLMFGDGLTVPVPDLDRTDLLVVFGANPLASNGSLMTAPNVRRRLRRIQERDGKVLVFDPRRSETAELADEHHFIRPGTDAFVLMAMANTLAAEASNRLGHTESLLNGLASALDWIRPFTADRVAGLSGVPAKVIETTARRLGQTERAVCYGRIGTTCQRYGTLASWAVDLVNILAGNLDRSGGAMFTRAAVRGGSSDEPGGRGVQLHRWKSRVRELPEVFGEFPSATLADEIETPGEGQVRALVTIAGNPVVSTPNAERLDSALASIDFMVSVDFYVNETTRHADVILPPTSHLEHDTYDLALYRLAIRNFAKYSPAVFSKADDQRHDWEILATLAADFMGFGPMAPNDVDDFVIGQLVEKIVSDEAGRRELAREALGDTPGPQRALDLMLRTGPYGENFGERSDGLNLDRLKDSIHGVDLGPLTEQLPGVLETPSGKIELAPDFLEAEVAKALAELKGSEASHDLSDPKVDPESAEGMVLIGRRHLRSNNSWCHNLPTLMTGKARCSVLIHPSDAQRLGITDKGRAKIVSRVGSVVAAVEISDEMMPGVVSLPHGWGHDGPGLRMEVAAKMPGVNSNILTDEEALDEPSGTAVLNGIPVAVTAA